MGRMGGSTSLPVYATKVHDDNGPEPERIDKDAEEDYARRADALSAALRQRAKLRAEIPVKQQELRRALVRAQQRGRVCTFDSLPQSVRVHQRAIKWRRKRIRELDAKIGRLEYERNRV
jgi:hypothetical protein